MSIIAALRTPVATLAVLCMALLAQLPHAADVFRMIVGADGWAAVNECRRRDWTAMYTTVADLLGWLRAAFDPGAERDPEDQSFERRWALLVGCRCLALDELTAFSATPWAAERFERLIDERWRNMGQSITLCAFNADEDGVTNLPGVVESRLRDRRAAWVSIGGTIDMRRVYRGDTER